MALPHRVVKVTLSGTMFGGQEIWSTGFYLGRENTDATAITTEGIKNVSDAWEVFFKKATVEISNKYQYTMCKMHVVEEDGKTVPDSAQYYAPLAVVNGGSTGQALPPQIALVATLANSLPRGLATKGRMFLPGVNGLVGADGHIGAGTIGGVADGLKIFFDTIYNDADIPGNPVLASVGRGPLNMDGAIRYVNSIKIGNVYDTQRRRRNALTEAYTSRAVAVV